MPGEFLSQSALVFLLVMTRIGVLFMLLPALGDQSIPARIRVAMSALLALVVMPAVASTVPAMPASIFDLFILVFYEFLVGVLIGSVLRIMLAAVHTTGTMIAYQTGLAAAQAFDPAQGGQTALVAKVLTIMSVTLIFVTDIHHLMLAGMQQSYALFPVGTAPPYDSMAGLVTRTVADSFGLGVQLAAPFIVYGLIFNLSMGLVARLMPALPVFFVGLPLNIMIGFALTAIVLGSMMRVFITAMENRTLDIFGF